MAVISKTLRLVKSVATVVCVVLNFTSFHIYAATNVPNTFNSGTPALASEVNENFSSVASSIDSHWSRFPDRYYPDWRYDPDFYLQLPSLAGSWKGRLESRDVITTRTRNLIFLARYDNSDPAKRVYLGITVVPSPDGSASLESGAVLGVAPLVPNTYSFFMSHQKDGSNATVTYTNDSSLDSLYASFPWRFYVGKFQVETLLQKIYAMLKMNSDAVVVNCGNINFHLNADRDISVAGSNCVETAY